MLRAIRDHLADSITTLPQLLKTVNNQASRNDASSSLHFYFGNMTAMRKHLAPSLLSAYEDWNKTKDTGALIEISTKLEEHWASLADKVKQQYQQSQIAEPIETLVTDNIF
jgi:hypothetical protein